MPKTKSNIPHLLGYTCTMSQALSLRGRNADLPGLRETGILDIDYDYDVIRRHFSRETLKSDHDNSMWRYKALFPLEDREYSSFCASAGRRYTVHFAWAMNWV